MNQKKVLVLNIYRGLLIQRIIIVEIFLWLLRNEYLE